VSVVLLVIVASWVIVALGVGVLCAAVKRTDREIALDRALDTLTRAPAALD
jgi:hypothetical protein